MYYSEIDGWFDFEGIYDKMVEQAPIHRVSYFVEVGVWLGRSICYLAEKVKESKKPIILYAVDHWHGSDELPHKRFLENIGGPEEFYNLFIQNMKRAGVLDIIVPLKLSSLDAASLFLPATIDFVFIDASHKYKDVIQDIGIWQSKIRKGGTFGGHDIKWPEVNKAVSDSFGSEFTIDCNSWIKQL